MAEKTIKSRIQVKRGTSKEWGKATTFVPKEGEIIFYSDWNKIKIGDGKTVVCAKAADGVTDLLPFLHVDASEIDGWSHNHDDQYYTEDEINTKLASLVTEEDLTDAIDTVNESIEDINTDLTSLSERLETVEDLSNIDPEKIATTDQLTELGTDLGDRIGAINTSLGDQVTYSFSNGTLTITTK